ncbi:MAG: hypothetical protein HKN09_07180, partial [Saprospiraceae bacterium]|nr:hypothetical protein [Saprospiraceae bacterium]
MLSTTKSTYACCRIMCLLMILTLFTFSSEARNYDRTSDEKVYSIINIEATEVANDLADDDFFTDCCDQIGKPTSMTFKFVGGGCGADNNSQGSKSDCDGGVTGNGPYSISEEDGANISVSSISVGDVFTVSDASKLPNPIVLRINGGQEVIEVHTSCSAPLVMGDRYGSLELLNYTDEDGFNCDGGNTPPPGGIDCCDVYGKPQMMTFRLVGGGCGADNNSQGSKSDCSGGISGSGPFSISEEDGASVSPSFASIGDIITVSDNDKLPNPIVLRLNNGQEVIEIHTSCSAPILIGERYGSLELLSYTDEDGGKCGNIPPPPPPPTGCAEVLVDYSGTCNDGPDSFSPSVTATCIGNATELGPT